MRYFLAALMLVSTALATDPVDPDRLPYGGTWEGIVGIDGGIPARETIYTTLTSSATAAQINTALNDCPDGQTVLLQAGTYSLSADITFTDSNVTLRGEVDANGVPTTNLVFASGQNIEFSAGSYWDFSDSGRFTSRTVSSGKTRGSTTVTVSSAPTGLTTGRLMWITATGSPIDGGGWTDFFGGQEFSQAVLVTGVDGNDITFSPAINADYISGLTVNVNWRDASNQISYTGLENVNMTNAAGAFNGTVVFMEGANQCWLKNVTMDGMSAPSSLNAFVYMYMCFRVEVRHCEIYRATSYGSSTYGMASVHSSNLWVEDNIFHVLPNIWPQMGTSGTVFSYNYFEEEPYQSANFLSQLVFHHGSHNHYNLYEGNWIPTHFNDASDSGNFSHSRNSVYFRQRLTGYDANVTQGVPKDTNAHAISFDYHHDYVVVAGCVMGTDGIQQDYLRTAGAVGGTNSIFNAEATTRSTWDLIANYNTVDDGIHSGEELGGGEVLADSYIYSSKPSWFGNLTWPWVDPTDFTQSNNHQNLPAGYRFENGEDPPPAAASPSVRRSPSRSARTGALPFLP